MVVHLKIAKEASSYSDQISAYDLSTSLASRMEKCHRVLMTAWRKYAHVTVCMRCEDQALYNKLAAITTP